jgi:hypothetical protein
MQAVDFNRNQSFFDLNFQHWKLIDITEVKSLLNEKKIQIVVHLFNPETKKIRRVNYVEFESNFRKIESGLIDEVTELNRLFSLE